MTTDLLASGSELVSNAVEMMMFCGGMPYSTTRILLTLVALHSAKSWLMSSEPVELSAEPTILTLSSYLTALAKTPSFALSTAVSSALPIGKVMTVEIAGS